MRKIVLGSKSVRGRKNRRVIKKQTARNPPIAVQVMRRRIVLTGSGGGSLATVLVLAPAELPTAVAVFAAGLSAVLTTGVFVAGGVTFGFSSFSTFAFVS